MVEEVTVVSAPRFTMIVLLVEDVGRSVAFYRRLGVAFPEDAERRRDVVVDLGGGHQLVLTTTFGDNVHDYVGPVGDGRVMLEFFVDDEDAVNATFAEIVGAGHRGRREPFRTDFGAYMGLVDDPDGNTVLITAG